VIPPWLSEGALNLAEPLHEMPRKQKNSFQNLIQTNLAHQKIILRIYFLATHLQNVRYEDVVCRLFPYTFAGKAIYMVF
jgi:hypothetical protein